jgi:hypothetical protein
MGSTLNIAIEVMSGCQGIGCCLRFAKKPYLWQCLDPNKRCLFARWRSLGVTHFEPGLEPQIIAADFVEFLT